VPIWFVGGGVVILGNTYSVSDEVNICKINGTSSVPERNSSFVLSQTFLSLTKFIEKCIKIYDTK